MAPNLWSDFQKSCLTRCSQPRIDQPCRCAKRSVGCNVKKSFGLKEFLFLISGHVTTDPREQSLLIWNFEFTHPLLQRQRNYVSRLNAQFSLRWCYGLSVSQQSGHPDQTGSHYAVQTEKFCRKGQNKCRVSTFFNFLLPSTQDHKTRQQEGASADGRVNRDTARHKEPCLNRLLWESSHIQSSGYRC